MRGKKIRAAQPRAFDDCQYSTSRKRGGLGIVLECMGCKGPANLENQQCFRGAVAAIQREGEPVSVTLRSRIERRYGPRAVRVLSQSAEILNRADLLLNQMRADSARSQECAACLSQSINRLGGMSQSLRAMELDKSLGLSTSLGFQSLGGSSDRCRKCSDMTVVQLREIARQSKDLERGLAMGVFNISEAER